MPANYGNLPFTKAIEYFRQKVNLPTERWTDIERGMHSRAFVAAGAQKSDLLIDLRASVDKAISQGTTLQTFRNEFDETVKKHGWNYKGSFGWRSKVIYETNLSVAYSAARDAQMRDPDVLKAFPYWRYRHDPARKEPRPEHVAWDNLTLRANDPWWDTHDPPKEYGCHCWKEVVSQEEFDAGTTGDTPTLKTQAPDDGTYEWTNPSTSQTRTIPNGVGPGWDYSPGKTAWGQQLSDDAMEGWKKQGAAAWERLTPGDAVSEGRPAEIPIDETVAKTSRVVNTEAELATMIRGVIGGEEKTFSYQRGNFTDVVHVNASTLARHVDPARSEFVELLPELLATPFEIWLSFEQHKGTGQTVLRERFIKGAKIGKEGYLMVCQANRGLMESWTFLPARNLAYLQKQRVGRLIWKRE